MVLGLNEGGQRGLLLTKEEKQLIYEILREQRKRYIFSRKKRHAIDRILLKIEQTERNVSTNEIKPTIL